MSHRRPGRLQGSAAQLRGLWDLYLWRVRQHPGQELMGGIGIAVGVALFFGVLLASANVAGSSAQLLHQLVGDARYVISARSPQGFNERLTTEVRELPGVQVAAPLLREQATVVGPKGRRPVELIGLSAAIVALEGEATRNLGAGAQLLSGGLGLPEHVAAQIGVRSNNQVKLLVRGQSQTLLVRAALGTQTIGPIAASPIAVGLLPTIQRASGLAGRVTSILVRPQPDTDQRVLAELNTLARGRLDVTSVNNEITLLREAAKPSNQSTTLFASIGAMVGFLLALNAALITTPDRRRVVAEMRVLGYSNARIGLILCFQAAILGLAGSTVGIIGGYGLFQGIFRSTPNFLASAFLLGPQRALTPTVVILAFACGFSAALAASTPCFIDLRTKVADAVLREAGEAGQRIAPQLVLRLVWAGAVLIALISLMVALAPSLTIIGGVTLALSAICFVPAATGASLWLLAYISDNVKGSAAQLAVAELRATATRSVALACIVALAVYGSVSVGGARHDLLRGLDSAIVQNWSAANVWITPDENIFDANNFRSVNALHLLAHVSVATHVYAYQGGFLDVGVHRLWIRVRPPNNPQMVLSTQLVDGKLSQATARLRRRGWATVSAGFADERHLNVGSSFALPTPAGAARFKVAAITTNIGWPSGTITLNSRDYRHYWNISEPTTLAIDLKPGVSPAVGRRVIANALASQRAVRIQTASERISEVERIVSDGLRNLGQIAMLILVAAALAVASALSAAIWQRRTYLASLKAQGYDRWQLWRALILEGSILMIVGTVDGTLLGIYGHALASRWLKHSTGFPTQFSFAEVQVFVTLALVIGIALLMMMLPGLSAVQVPAHESFQE